MAAGSVARNFLRQVFGIEVLSHVISIGASDPYDGPAPRYSDLPAIDESRSGRSIGIGRQDDRRDRGRQKDGDTLGGIVEIVATGVPIGLGSHVSGETRLDAKLAAALMGIQAIKGSRSATDSRRPAAAAVRHTTRWCPDPTACCARPTAPAASKAA